MQQKYHTRWLWAGAIVAVALSASSAVAMVKDISLAEAIQQSKLIVKGKVVSTHSMWAGRHIYTYVTIQVDTKIKGTLASNPMILETDGGTVGDITEEVSDVATFQRGEEVVLFLAGTPLRPVGGFQGKYLVSVGKVYANGALMDVGAFLQGIRTVVEQPAAGLSLPDGGTITVTGAGETVAPDTLGGKNVIPEVSSPDGAPVVLSSGLVPAEHVRNTPKPAPQPGAPQKQTLTATIFNAWWTGAVDWDHDYYAHTATLNWDADVAGGAGSIAVFAKVYYKISSASTCNLLWTSPQYNITNTATTDAYWLGINGGTHNLYDWRIEIFRAGHTSFDGWRSAANDTDLNDYHVETAAQDAVATIFNAWWSNTVDSDGDGYKRSARLNWDADVANGVTGSLSVFEKIYAKQASAATWGLIYTTSAHTITGQSTADARYLDLNGGSHGAYDVKIEVFRSGATTRDYSRDPVTDSDLNDYRMETAAEDVGGGGGSPTISSISPASASAGTNSTVVTINGSGFGATQGTGHVDFFYRSGQPKIPAQIVSWSATQIKCYVPIGVVNGYSGSAGSGPVTVVTGSGLTSAGYNFKVKFGYGQHKWSGTNPVINYKINENCADCTGEGAAVQAAANSWNAVGSKLHFTYTGSHTNTAVGANGVNQIMWGSASSPGIIATASYWWSTSTGFLMECDICFNDPGFLWNTASTVPTNRMDVQTIALHELGHWLNLRDLYGNIGDGVYDNGKVMYGFCGNGVNKRILHADDRAGILWIYP